MEKAEAELDVDALVLAAGFGKRLRPLTENTPKPLVHFCGRPLLDRTLEMLASSGIRKVWINTHYLAPQIEDYVADGARWGLEVCFSREAEILDTGGAIKKIESNLEHNELLVVNSDIVLGGGLNLRAFIAAHRNSAHTPRVSMLLGNQGSCEEYGTIGLDEGSRICRFLDLTRQNEGDRGSLESRTSRGPEPVRDLIYLGVMIINRSVISNMPGNGRVFSITRDTLRELFAEGAPLSGYVYEGFWSDLGTPSRLETASKLWEQET